jgi:hypothetical protein
MQNSGNEGDSEKKEFDEKSVEQEIEIILSEIAKDPEEAHDLDAILAILLDHGIIFDNSDLAALVAKFLSRMQNRSNSKASIDKVKISNILQTLQTDSNFLLVQNALSVQQISGKKQQNTQQKDNLKEPMKRCIIYEAYKIVSPRAIAGETVESNFKNNIIMRGVDKALKIEKKTMEQAEKKYGKNFMKDLENQQKSSSKGRGR